jgi:hypothetical protein
MASDTLGTDAGSGSGRNSLRVLDPKRLRLRQGPFGRLEVEIGFEERYSAVRALRAFPLNHPTQFISLQQDEGEEIGLIEDLAELDAESRAAVEAELDFYYLKAEVRQIHKVESRNGIITFDMDTSLGRRRTHVRDRQNIRVLPSGRVVLTDIHGGKYEVPSLDSLDPRSRHRLEVEM